QRGHRAHAGHPADHGPRSLRTVRRSPRIRTASIGKEHTLRDGSDVTLIGCGLMVARCLEAAQTLERERISARVINLSTVKPLDLPTIDRAARETGRIVTAEEHTVVHGIGAAVAAAIAANRPVPIAMVGVQDVFGE